MKLRLEHHDSPRHSEPCRAFTAEGSGLKALVAEVTQLSGEHVSIDDRMLDTLDTNKQVFRMRADGSMLMYFLKP